LQFINDFSEIIANLGRKCEIQKFEKSNLLEACTKKSIFTGKSSFCRKSSAILLKNPLRIILAGDSGEEVSGAVLGQQAQPAAVASAAAAAAQRPRHPQGFYAEGIQS